MGSCITPITVRKKTTNQSVAVPCGRCPNCLKRRVSAWSFRLMQEFLSPTTYKASFITLTYDSQHVPFSRNGFMELRKRDLQLFFKRLRKAHEKYNSQIRYYSAGEYGGNTRRPHYHIIIYNAKPELIECAWQLGSIHIGELTEASVGYTLKYITKPWRLMHINDDRQPQFALMSKGLGLNYLTPKMVAWHKKDLDNRMYCNLKDGKKCSMPRYYKDKIYAEDERKRIGVKAKVKMEWKEQQLDKKYGRENRIKQKVISDKGSFDRYSYEQNLLKNKL